MNDNQPSGQDAATLQKIKDQVLSSCKASKYSNLCQRIDTVAGFDYVVNRCIELMARDKIHLSAALAQLESEEQGID